MPAEKQIAPVAADATGLETELGRLGALVNVIEEGPTPLERRLDVLGRRLAWLTIGVARVVSTISSIIHTALRRLTINECGGTDIRGVFASYAPCVPREGAWLRKVPHPAGDFTRISTLIVLLPEVSAAPCLPLPPHTSS